MQYLKLESYKYTDIDDEDSLLFGQDETGVFFYQIIINKEITSDSGIQEAVEMVHNATRELIDEDLYNISFDKQDSITIDGNEHIICLQRIHFKDGNESVQQNAYFIDPDNGFLAIIQFGTAPINNGDWETYGDALVDYTGKTIRRIISNMSLPQNIHFPITNFRWEENK